MVTLHGHNCPSPSYLLAVTFCLIDYLGVIVSFSWGQSPSSVGDFFAIIIQFRRPSWKWQYRESKGLDDV